MRLTLTLALTAALVLLPFGQRAAALDDETIAALVDGLSRATAAVVGAELTAGEVARLEQEVRTTVAVDEQTISTLFPVIMEMGAALNSVEHPATRERIRDGFRIAIAEAFRPVVRALPLEKIEAIDPTVAEHSPGMGMARSDVVAAAWLRALYEGGAFSEDVSDAAFARELSVKRAEFAADAKEDRQVHHILAAWAAGTHHAWEDMTPAERRAAAGAGIVDDLPPDEVVRKVTGTDDLLFWVAGLQLALSEEERAAYPAMVAFFEGGKAGQAMQELIETLVQGLATLAQGQSAVLASQHQSYLMMYNLNNFFMREGTASGIDPMSVMLGWE